MSTCMCVYVYIYIYMYMYIYIYLFLYQFIMSTRLIKGSDVALDAVQTFGLARPVARAFTLASCSGDCQKSFNDSL